MHNYIKKFDCSLSKDEIIVISKEMLSTYFERRNITQLYDKYYILIMPIFRAYESNDRELVMVKLFLNLMETNFTKTRREIMELAYARDSLFNMACCNGDLELVKILYNTDMIDLENLNLGITYYDIFLNCCMSNNIELVEYIDSLYHDPHKVAGIIKKLLFNKKFKVLSWLATKYSIIYELNECFITICKDDTIKELDKIDIVKWYDFSQIKLLPYYIEEAATICNNNHWGKLSCLLGNYNHMTFIKCQ